jgi:signal transduction histidine kinase
LPRDTERLIELADSLGSALGIPPEADPGGDPVARVEDLAQALILASESSVRSEQAARLELERRLERLLDELEGLALGEAGAARTPAAGVGDRIERTVRSLERTRDRSEYEKQRLQLVLRDLERFLALVSHELKVPLTSVRSYSEILLMELRLTPEQKEFLQTIVEETERMAGMINDLVDLERVRAGRFRMDLKDARIQDCILRALRTVHPLCLEHRILMRLEVPDDLPRVALDTDRIVQVLVNLLSNCIKYSPAESSVTIGARLLGDGQVEVSVRDHGPGVPGERLRSIFELYEGAGTRGVRGELGTGLGLAISRRIVDGHGGTIRAELPEDGGTRFVFVLPAPGRS